MTALEMKRREFLRATAALAAAGAIGPAPSAKSQQVPQASPAQSPGQFSSRIFSGGLPVNRKLSRLFGDVQFNYVFAVLLGSAYYRGADAGACLAIADQIVDGDRMSAFRALAVAGDRLSNAAAEAEAAGNQASARESYMHAASYVYSATYFVNLANALDAFNLHWLRHQALWEKAAALLEPRAESLPFPYEKTTLPGHFFKVDNSGKRRPLVIVINWSDGGMPTAWAFGIAPALGRGYNVYAFYGPGQGTALLQQNLYARADWERVISPLIDYLLIRRDVDPERIALLGIGQGAYWAARAAAFEARLGACVADPGVWDVSTAWTQLLPKPLLEMLDAGKKDKFDALLRLGLRYNPRAAAELALRMLPFGTASPYEAFRAIQAYRLSGVAGQIRCPTLVTESEGELLWRDQSKQLYDALMCPKALIKFHAAEGADLSSEPKAPGLRSQRIFDWLNQAMKRA
jgi:hypothetical protein